MSCPPIDLTSSPAIAPQELETTECLIWSDGVEIISVDLQRKILFMNDLQRSGGALSPDYLLRLMMFQQAFEEKRKNEEREKNKNVRFGAPKTTKRTLAHGGGGGESATESAKTESLRR